MKNGKLFPMIWSSGDPLDELGKIDRSLRFRSSASTYLARNIGSAPSGSGKKWTLSVWVKRGTLGQKTIVGSRIGAQSGSYFAVVFEPGDTLTIGNSNGGTYDNHYTTSQVFKDTSSHYHIQVVWDSDHATASERFILYVNGARVTSFSSSSVPALGYVSTFMYPGFWTTVGGMYQGTLTGAFDGNISNVCFVDNQALLPTTFGQFHSVTGQWRPFSKNKIRANVALGGGVRNGWGANGFFLPFDNISSTAALGYDKSQSDVQTSGVNFVVSNLSLTADRTYDSSLDTPTNNVNTLIPLMGYSTLTYTDANSRGNCISGSIQARYGVSGLIPPGDWVYEAQLSSYSVGNSGNNIMALGVHSSDAVFKTNQENGTNYGWASDGTNMVERTVNRFGGSTLDASTLSSTPFTATDILAVRVNTFTNTVSFYKNGVLRKSYVITNFNDFVFTICRDGTTNAAVWDFNFGHKPFAFSYDGAKALTTKNLDKPRGAALRPSDYFDIKTYAGNGSTQTISGVNFPPDFVWIKTRNTPQSNATFDTIRGVQKILTTDSSNAESTDSTALVAFNSNGFSTGNSANTNQNGIAYVAWMWKAFGTPVSNTDGTIASMVSANKTSGFSMVSYTGNGLSSATVGHGLGVAPAMIIVKARGAATSWFAYQRSLSAGVQLRLSSSNPAEIISSGTTDGGLGAPNANTFGFIQGTTNTNNVNQSGIAYLAYCFAEIPGYSRIYSYYGNGVSDGSFVYCGFRPKWIMVKSANDTGSYWAIMDSARNTFNATNSNLFADRTLAENSNLPAVDFLSNGFKLRTAPPDNGNYTSSNMIFMAFAEFPFRYANAK